MAAHDQYLDGSVELGLEYYELHHHYRSMHAGKVLLGSVDSRRPLYPSKPILRRCRRNQHALAHRGLLLAVADRVEAASVHRQEVGACRDICGGRIVSQRPPSPPILLQSTDLNVV